jgi:hypothetical protein
MKLPGDEVMVGDETQRTGRTIDAFEARAH